MSKIILHALAWISKYLPYLILLTITLGLLNLYFFEGFVFNASICFLAAIIMITPSLVPLDFTTLTTRKDSEKSSGGKKILLLSFLLNFILYPFFAFLLGTLFFSNNPQLFFGLLLLSILPGGGMVTTWVMRSGASLPLAIKIIFYNLLLVAAFLPFFLSNFMLEPVSTSSENLNQLSIDFEKIQEATGNPESIIDIVNKEKNLEKDSGCVLSTLTGGYIECGQSDNPLFNLLPIIFTIILLPLFLAFIIQKTYIKFRGKSTFLEHKKYFGSFANIGLLIILFIVLSFESNSIIFDSWETVLLSVFTVGLFYALVFSVSFLAYYILSSSGTPKDYALSFFWGTSLRYITLILAFASAVSSTDPSYTIISIIAILAYFIQIPLSYFFSEYFNSFKKD